MKSKVRDRLKIYLLDRRELDTVTGCWLWTQYIDPEGRGQSVVGKKYGLSRRVHRLAFELWKGHVPKNMLVCHHCDNPKCFNPDHLFLGTHADNTKDALDKGRLAVLERHSQAKLNWDKVREIKDRIKAGETYRDISKDFGVTESNIRAIGIHKTWR